MEPRNILIVGNYGAGNLGDDAILGGILTDLKNVGYAGIIAVTHGGVKTSSEIYKGLKKVPFVPAGFRSRFKKSRHEATAAVKAADLVIWEGEASSPMPKADALPSFGRLKPRPLSN